MEDTSLRQDSWWSAMDWPQQALQRCQVVADLFFAQTEAAVARTVVYVPSVFFVQTTPECLFCFLPLETDHLR